MLSARVIGVSTHDFDEHLDDLIVKIEQILKTHGGQNNIDDAYLARIAEHRASANQTFELPAKANQIPQWRLKHPHHEWLRLKNERRVSLT
ncbi:hypothetical protein [uncultured Endozoicomonas sp.]|uniref:hypothetical protein n=1 Tax=uncultured Endozoicomonas sp. TaxID=432652 RepID=UPI0026393C96|nr:hypothetical protein [uncultured Endozoicomonas sp.]